MIRNIGSSTVSTAPKTPSSANVRRISSVDMTRIVIQGSFGDIACGSKRNTRCHIIYDRVWRFTISPTPDLENGLGIAGD
jgi:hypothetical protein